MPQPSFRSSNSATDNSAESIAIPEPPGSASGDYCVLFVAHDRTNGSWAAVTGFALQDEFHEDGLSTGWWDRTLDGGESWPITVAKSGSASGEFIGESICLNPEGGAVWVVEDNSSVSDNVAAAQTVSVTGVADCMMLGLWGHDAADAVSVEPAAMTAMEYDPEGTIVLTSYYEQRGVGAIQKTLTWASQNGSPTYAMIISIGAGVGAVHAGPLVNGPRIKSKLRGLVG